MTSTLRSSSSTPDFRPSFESSARKYYMHASCSFHLILLILLLLLLALPAAALDTVYLVRHAEKAGFWSADRDLDAFQPLSQEGIARAAALAERLKTAGIVAVYTSRTTRTIETGAPLVQATGIPITADDATTKPDEMAAFLSRLRE